MSSTLRHSERLEQVLQVAGQLFARLGAFGNLDWPTSAV